MRARPPAKPARHSPEAKPMADGQGEAGLGHKRAGIVTKGSKPREYVQKMKRVFHVGIFLLAKNVQKNLIISQSLVY
jgi:hypothetical protein